MGWTSRKYLEPGTEAVDILVVSLGPTVLAITASILLVGCARGVESSARATPTSIQVDAKTQQSIDELVCKGGVVLSAKHTPAPAISQDPNLVGDLNVPDTVSYRIRCPNGTIRRFTESYYLSPRP